MPMVFAIYIGPLVSPETDQDDREGLINIFIESFTTLLYIALSSFLQAFYLLCDQPLTIVPLESFSWERHPRDQHIENIYTSPVI